MASKKILIVTRNLPPLIGGMERLNWHIADELSHDNDILLLSHKDAEQYAPQRCKFFSVTLNPLPLFLILAFFKTFILCLRYKPDVIYAGSGLTAPIVVFFGKIFRKKSIVYIHGLDISNTSLVYKFLWLPFIRQSSLVIANSTPTMNLAIKNKVRSCKIKIIHPGVSFPPPPINIDMINHLKDKFNLHRQKILLSVGRLTERKGLLEFVRYCLPSIIDQEPNTILVVIGDMATQALNKKLQTHKEILEIAKMYNIEKNIVFTGNVQDQLLSQFYYLADLHIFPVKHIPNDPEGFGMVALEAAAHGTPTVAFATGGVIDAVEHSISGYLVKYNEYESLAEHVIYILTKDLNMQKNCQTFASSFSWTKLGNKMTDAIDSVSD